MPTDSPARPEARPGEDKNSEPPPRRLWPWLALLTAAICVGYPLLTRFGRQQPLAAEPAAHGRARAVPVVAAVARRGDMPVYLTGLGTVTAFNTVTVRSRVDGELIKIAFREGQYVHEGDLLAEIDPRPFQVQLTQAEGQMTRDAAQLKNAQLNLKRYRDLLAQQVVSQQEYDAQVATVGQYDGAVQMDRGLIDNAKLQLSYCRITAPISGRVGLRLVDVGNMVHASDQKGLLVITQMQPISVLFTISEDDLPPVLKKLQAGDDLKVEAFDRAGQKQIATGSLLTTDNQIDPTTGTMRLKAVFPNPDEALFPNQFVNVRLLIDVRKNSVIVPMAAIQHGPQGPFVYVVKADRTVEVRPVTLGPATGADAAIARGLSAAEKVVVDGVDKLRPGSLVEAKIPSETPGRTPGA